MSKYEKRLDSHELQLRIRYERAFHKSKVNWLQVKFDPVTPLYEEDKKEQKYLADYGFNLFQAWRPNKHLMSNNNSEPERQKIIDQERIKREKADSEEFDLSPYSNFYKKEIITKTSKTRTPAKNEKKRIRREFCD